MSTTRKIAFFVAGIAILGTLIVLVAGRNKTGDGLPQTGSRENVMMEGDRQVIEIYAKGGYTPAKTYAKANTPTMLRVKTNGTFDCSSALTIPSLGYRSILPPSGETLIEVPPQAEGSVLRGTCSMGMYRFEVAFNG